MDLISSSSRFKRARSVGAQAGRKSEAFDKDKLFWKRFRCIKQFEYNASVSCCAFAPSGPADVLVASAIRLVIRREASDYEVEKKLLTVRSIASATCFRSDGRLAAVGSGDGKIFVVDVSSRTVLREFNAHKASVRCLGFMFDNQRLVSSGDDGKVCVWDVTSGSLVWDAQENTDFVRTLSISRFTPGLFITGSYDHSATLWSVEGNTPLKRFTHESPVESVVFLKPNLVAIAGQTKLKIWNTLSESIEREIVLHHKTITSLSVSSDNKYLITSSLDCSVKILLIESFELVRHFKLPSSVLSVSTSQDGRKLVAGTSNGHLFIFGTKSDSDETLSLETEHLKSSTKQKTPKPKSHSKDLIFTDAENDTLSNFDKLLKAYRYRLGFDTILSCRNPHLMAIAVRELVSRQGLLVALSGRSEPEVCLILDFLARYLSDSKYSSYMIEVAFVMLDIYSASISSSRALHTSFAKLKGILSRVIKSQKLLTEIEGQVTLIAQDSI